jgi:hypothetical protein
VFHRVKVKKEVGFKVKGKSGKDKVAQVYPEELRSMCSIAVYPEELRSMCSIAVYPVELRSVCSTGLRLFKVRISNLYYRLNL